MKFVGMWVGTFAGQIDLGRGQAVRRVLEAQLSKTAVSVLEVRQGVPESAHSLTKAGSL